MEENFRIQPHGISTTTGKFQLIPAGQMAPALPVTISHQRLPESLWKLQASVPQIHPESSFLAYNINAKRSP
jgi:hypothetical protein